MGHAEAGLKSFLGILALVMTDEHTLEVADASEAANDRSVVSVVSVAVEFAEVTDHQVDVVRSERPFGVSGHLDDFPCVKLGVQLSPGHHQFGADSLDRTGEVSAGDRLTGFQLFNLPFDLGKRAFKLQVPAKAKPGRVVGCCTH